MPDKLPDYMTVKETAEYLKCDVQTVRKYIKIGKLEASQIVPKGTMRISTASVERLLGRTHA